MSSGRDGGRRGNPFGKQEEKRWGKMAGRQLFLVNLSLSHSLPM